MHFQIEFGLEFRGGQLLTGILGGQPDDYIAQLSDVSGKVIVTPGLLCLVVEGKRRKLRLFRVELAVVLEQQRAVIVHFAQRRHFDREHR